jgi:hypothetical protein
MSISHNHGIEKLSKSMAPVEMSIMPMIRIPISPEGMDVIEDSPFNSIMIPI